MTNESKTKIKELVGIFCEGFASQAKASKALRDVSPGTISQMLNNNWDLISDKMWTNVGKQVGFDTEDWKIAETYNYKLLNQILLDAKLKSRTFCIIGGAGWGKDTSAKSFRANNQNVYIINCNETVTERVFLMLLLRAMGENYSGTSFNMLERIISILNKKHKPLIIINEMDKLKPPAFNLFISLYNECEDKCGLVIMGTSVLENRIKSGVIRQIKGYSEVFSRIDDVFMTMKKPSKSDVAAICTANGVTDPFVISEIYNRCESGSLRLSKKLIQNKADHSGENKGDQAA